MNALKKETQYMRTLTLETVPICTAGTPDIKFLLFYKQWFKAGAFCSAVTIIDILDILLTFTKSIIFSSFYILVLDTQKMC